MYSDAACANQVFVSSNRTVNLTTPTSWHGHVGVRSSPTNAGNYFWRAFYSGDRQLCRSAASVALPARPARSLPTSRRSPRWRPTRRSAARSVTRRRLTSLVNPVVGAGAGTVEFRLHTAMRGVRGLDLRVEATARSTAARFRAARRRPRRSLRSTRATTSGAAFYSGDANNHLRRRGACAPSAERARSRRTCRRSPTRCPTRRSVSRSATRRR